MAYADIKSPPGMFWCRAHGIDMPLSVRSEDDPRYCKECYAVIQSEQAPRALPNGSQAAISPPPLPRQLNLGKSVIPEAIDRPVKPPYHRHGQSNIYDYYIDEAIAAGGGYRTIAAALEQKGIKVSHMTIKRRIERKDKNLIPQGG